MLKYYKPDFICIGPEKTGTTWLYQILKKSNEVKLPPLKEIRYFNEGAFIPIFNMDLRQLSNHWSDQKLIKLYKDEIKKVHFNGKFLNTEKKERYDWFKCFFNSNHDNEWYSKLYSKDYISGDISPTYNFIKESKIKDISKSFPEMKIILIIRNPLERLWAKAIMNLCKNTNRKLEQVSDKEFELFFMEEFELWIPYPELVHIWSKYFTHIHIAYFDQLCESPLDFIKEISEFLGISIFETNNYFEKVNEGINYKIPETYKELLDNYFRDEIKKIKKLFPSKYIDSWGD